MLRRVGEALARWPRRRRVRRLLEEAEVVGGVAALVEWDAGSDAGEFAFLQASAVRELAEYVDRTMGEEAARLGVARELAEAYRQGREARAARLAALEGSSESPEAVLGWLNTAVEAAAAARIATARNGGAR